MAILQTVEITTADPATVTSDWRPPDIINEIDAGTGLLKELIETFRVDTGSRLRGLHQAIATLDSRRVRKEAHSIKGSAGQMGVEAMVLLCREIERAADGGSSWEDFDAMAKQLDESFVGACDAMARYACDTPGAVGP